LTSCFGPGKNFVLSLLDEIFTGGLGSILRDAADNWADRREERRLFYIGVINIGACLIMMFLAKQLLAWATEGKTT